MCDCLVALGRRTTTGKTLFAKNSDRPPAETQVIRWNPPRRDTAPVTTTHIAVDPWTSTTHACVMSMPEWCWGAEHGVNEHGVAIGNETIYTTLDPRPAPAALIGMDLVRLGLERAASARDAVGVIMGLIERYGQGGSGHDTRGGARPRPYWSSFLVADPDDAWVVETSGNLAVSMQVESTWAISNRTTIPDFDRNHRHPRQPVERLVNPRLDASRQVLSRDGLSAGDLCDHLSSHVGGDDGWTVCMHARRGDELVETTTASMVAELDAVDPIIWWTQASPCETGYLSARFSEIAGLVPSL